MLENSFRVKKQQGFTATGWIIVVMIGGFFVYLGMILFPVLVSNHTLGGILTSLQSEPGIVQKSKKDIRSLIYNRLTINDIRDVKTSDFEIIKEGSSRIIIYLDFENRIEFAKDIYIVIVNNKEVELTAN